MNSLCLKAIPSRALLTEDLFVSITEDKSVGKPLGQSSVLELVTNFYLAEVVTVEKWLASLSCFSCAIKFQIGASAH